MKTKYFKPYLQEIPLDISLQSYTPSQVPDHGKDTSGEDDDFESGIVGSASGRSLGVSSGPFGNRSQVFDN